MSTISVGQMNQLGNALEAAGFNENLVTKLGQCGRLADIRALLEGKAEIVMRKTKEVVIKILTLVKTITMTAVAGKKTRGCFTNKSLYYYRDPDLDNWLPIEQPAQTESDFSVHRLTHNATFKLAAESFLGLCDSSIEVLANALKERGHVTTLPAVESLIERQENGEDVGLRTDGYANFFFVLSNEGSVSVVYAYRYDRQWYVHVFRLGSGSVWLPETRFFFRN